MKRDDRLHPPLPKIKVTIVRREASPERYAKLVRLLSVLLDKPDTPEEGGRR